MSETTKTGAELIAEERQRQIAIEGWSSKHDDKYTGGELPAAASAYVLFACDQLDQDYSPSDFDSKSESRLENAWPWNPEWWKPSPDPIRNLVKAGALIAAEIDRLQRRATGGEQ